MGFMQFKSQIISISGIDGCGKTTIIEKLRKSYKKQGFRNKYIWLRYNHYLTKFILLFCRLTGLTKYEYIDGVRVGYHNFHKSVLISYLFIFFTFIDTLFISIFKVYLPALFLKEIIICDRWIPDIIVDLEIDTGINFTKNKFLFRIFLLLIPSSCRCFVIERNQEAVLNSRVENAYDRNFQRRVQLYKKHSLSQWLCVIDNNGTIQSSIDSIQTELDK